MIRHGNAMIPILMCTYSLRGLQNHIISLNQVSSVNLKLKQNFKKIRTLKLQRFEFVFWLCRLLWEHTLVS